MKKFKYFKQFESKKDKFPNIKKVEIDGYTILVGRDAESNDHLSINMAYPEDLWFHAKGCPGSHVIIRLKDKLATNEIKKVAAKLAILNSKNKNSGGKVICCKAKFVSKSGDMEPGEVSVDRKNSEDIEVKI